MQPIMLTTTSFSPWEGDSRVKIGISLFPALLLLLAGCDPCSYGVQNEIRSPSGKNIATIYQTDCGATTDFATALSVRPSGKPFRPSTNLALGIPGQQPLSISWLSDSELVVAVPKGVELHVKKDEINGVTIRYQTAD